jgi:GLPGLI family protein
MIKAQQPLASGIIEYECKMNLHKMMQEESESWYEMAKDHTPQYAISYNNLIFDSCHSIFLPGKESSERNEYLGEDGPPEDYIYSNFCTQEYIASREVFDARFLVKDSLSQIRWKIIGDSRDIAGYSCKKATAIVHDSVYLIAFFSEDIICPSGPASVCGLPGTILGLVVPRIHTTWFATSVKPLYETERRKLIPPEKGKPSNRKNLLKKLQETFTDWGKSYIISFTI